MTAKKCKHQPEACRSVQPVRSLTMTSATESKLVYIQIVYLLNIKYTVHLQGFLCHNRCRFITHPLVYIFFFQSMFPIPQQSQCITFRLTAYLNYSNSFPWRDVYLIVNIKVASILNLL